MIACLSVFVFSSTGSRRDAVVPHNEVRAFGESLSSKLSKHGIACRLKVWDEGAHCEMLREDPGGYKGEIEGFLRSLPQ